MCPTYTTPTTWPIRDRAATDAFAGIRASIGHAAGSRASREAIRLGGQVVPMGIVLKEGET